MLENKDKTLDYLRYLIWIRLGAVALQLLCLVPVVDTIAEWLDILPNLALVVVFWLLSNGKDRYWKAFIYLAVSVGISFIARAFGSPVFLIVMLASSVCSFIAVYQEYNAHAELIEPVAPTVAGRWHSLFNWQVVYLLVVYVMALVMAAILLDYPMFSEIYAWAIQVVNLIYAWFYLRNLDDMRKVLSDME